jgi:hypothetical protein
MSTVRPTAYRVRARLERPGRGLRVAGLLVVAAAVFVEAFLFERASSVPEPGPTVAPYHLPGFAIPTSLRTVPAISALRVAPRPSRPAPVAKASARPVAAVRAPSSAAPVRPSPPVTPAPTPKAAPQPTAAPPPPARSPAPRPAPSSGGGGSGGSGGSFFQSG